MVKCNSLRRVIPALFVLVVGAAMLTGCGGGGASGGSGLGGGGGSGSLTSAAISGTVLMPPVSGAAWSRGDSYEPVPGATVELRDVDTDAVVETTTSDGSGKYEFKDGVVDNHDYNIEAVAKRGGKDYTVSAIVSTGDLKAAKSERSIDPLTTVAAKAALEQLKAAKEKDPEFKSEHLEDVSKDIEDKNRDTFVAPDVSDDKQVDDKKNEVLQNVSPDGNYVGRFSGNGDEGMVAAIIKNGKFAIIGMSDADLVETKSIVNFEDTNSGSDNPTTDPNTDKGSPMILGTVDSTGVIVASGKNGQLKLTGIIVGDKGVGTYLDTSNGREVKGTWKIARRTFDWAGLYAGKWNTETGKEMELYTLVTNDKKMFYHVDVDHVPFQIGFGEVSNTGSFTLKIRDLKNKIQYPVTGQINDGSMDILIPAGGGKTNKWTLTLNFDPSAP